MNTHDSLMTPAFIWDQRILRADLQALREITNKAGCNLLYSPKACSLAGVLSEISPFVDGFACSSAFELRLVDQICDRSALRSVVSPFVEEQTVSVLGDRLDYLTANSLSQWDRIRTVIPSKVRVGLRINPQISFIGDARYDPCRQNSKLGVRLDRLGRISADRIDGISGLHFHTNCDETDFAGLLATARHIRDVIPELLGRMSWINMGGGYLFNEATDHDDFFAAVEIFRDEFELNVFIEPGASLVRRAGTIEATVHDIFEGDESQIAVLDTTVNHMSEVFEFQFEPDVLGHVDGGMHNYNLVGSTCLAGDVFGDYSFDRPLSVGSNVTFLNMGAYTTTKAHRFNGVPLPTIYARRQDGTLEMVHEDRFEDFARQMGIGYLASH